MYDEFVPIRDGTSNKRGASDLTGPNAPHGIGGRGMARNPLGRAQHSREEDKGTFVGALENHGNTRSKGGKQATRGGGRSILTCRNCF